MAESKWRCGHFRFIFFSHWVHGGFLFPERIYMFSPWVHSFAWQCKFWMFNWFPPGRSNTAVTSQAKSTLTSQPGTQFYFTCGKNTQTIWGNFVVYISGLTVTYSFKFWKTQWAPTPMLGNLSQRDREGTTQGRCERTCRLYLIFFRVDVSKLWKEFLWAVHCNVFFQQWSNIWSLSWI